jgi:molybdopterin synthase sulfur carrier subunit
MPVVWIPSLLRDLTGGRASVTVDGTTVGQLITVLDRSYPGIKDRLCDANGLRSSMAVAVGAQLAPLGLLQPVTAADEVYFIAAIGGG